MQLWSVAGIWFAVGVQVDADPSAADVSNCVVRIHFAARCF